MDCEFFSPLFPYSTAIELRKNGLQLVGFVSNQRVFIGKKEWRGARIDVARKNGSHRRVYTNRLARGPDFPFFFFTGEVILLFMNGRQVQYGTV